MKRLLPWLAALVLVATAVAVWSGRPEPFDEHAFGKALALEPNLTPLTHPGGALVLAGRIETHAGQPAVDAFVTLSRPNPLEDGPAPVRGEYTDGEGRFRFEGLAPGSYRVVLQHPSAPPRAFTTELPGPDEVRWSLPEPLPPIEAMPPIQRGALGGRIVAPEGMLPRANLAGFEVLLIPAAETAPLAGAAVRRASCDAEGRFAFSDLVCARYDAQVLPPWARGGSWPVLGRGTCAHAGEGTELTLELAVGTLTGRLIEPPDRPLVGALVSVTSLTARDVLGKPQLWPPLVTDADGRFTSELLPVGRYRLHARAGEGVQDLEFEVQAGVTRVVPFALLSPRQEPAR